MVDWNDKIEAVHDDGRVVPVVLTETDSAADAGRMRRRIQPMLDTITCWFDEDGTHEIPERKWRIRNVEPARKFKVGDRVNHLYAEDLPRWVGSVVERIDADGEVWVRAKDGTEGCGPPDNWELAHDEPTDELSQLRQFKADALAAGYVPKAVVPIDPDLKEANEIARECGWPEWESEDTENPMWDGSGAYLALRAIRRGRELAALEANPY